MATPHQESAPRRDDGVVVGRRNDAKDERAVVESIREATGASVEEIQYQLRECEGDVNKATEKLIDTPFTVVQSKKPKARAVRRGAPRGRAPNYAGATGRHSDPNAPRGRGGYGTPRGRGGYRNRFGGRGKTEAVEKENEGRGEAEKEVKPVAPPVPIRKAYLEALCGKPNVATAPGGDMIKSGFLVQKEDMSSFAASGWEVASSPPDTPVAAFRAPELPDDIASEEEKSIKVDSVADIRHVEEEMTPWANVKEEMTPWANVKEEQELGEGSEEDVSKTDAFPIPMQDIRFTREDTTPLAPMQLPIAFKMESTFARMPNLEDAQLDMSSVGYLFGTFEGLSAVKADPNSQPEMKILPDPVQEEICTEEPKSGFIVEPDVVERLEAVSLTTPQTNDTDADSRLQALARSSVEFLHASDAPQPLSLDTFSKPVDFRLDVGTQVLDVEVPQPPEQAVFISTGPSIKEDPTPMHLIGDSARSEKTFVGSMPPQDKPHPMPPLNPTQGLMKAFQESYTSTVESKKSEERRSFEPPEPRQQPHRQSAAMSESKPVLDTEPAYGIASGPTPTVPSYQPQRHQPPHKLHEKSMQPTVGVPGHPQNPKYASHPSTGFPHGQTAIPAVQVPVSLNPNSSTNPSLPMMQQVPFLNPGMMHNPAMPFPPGNPYYPQFMQYQHQMYHGMYAGTYGGFGAPFNHESVGHPAHANPVGVPPNQGNTVYDTNNPSTFSNSKEKDNVFLNQQQLPHAPFPGAPQQYARNEGGMFFAVPPGQFSQGFRNQFHQPPGFATQFPPAGYVAPPHTYHPPGPGGNLRFH